MRLNLILVLCCVWFLAGLSQVKAAAITGNVFVDILIDVESSNNDYPPIGDGGKAFGPLQIHEEVCLDVNKRFGTDYHAEDCQGNRVLSKQIFWGYMSIYATSERLGHEPTCEDWAKIWKAGPSGCFQNGAVDRFGHLAKNLRTRAKLAGYQDGAKDYWGKKVLPRIKKVQES